MKAFIDTFVTEAKRVLDALPNDEIAKAMNTLQAVYERDGRIYIFGNGGSSALSTHFVGDFNKTVFSHNLQSERRRFQAIRLPSTEEELSAWANDVGYEEVFSGPLKNYLQETDCIIAISSSGNSPNIIKAVEFAKARHVPVIGFSGFDGGTLNKRADIKILIRTKKGRYDLVESMHALVLHLITTYFQNYFDHLSKKKGMKRVSGSRS